MFDYFSSSPYPKFKLTILALLTLNAIIYAMVDTFTNAVDASVWVMLLMLYELEINGSSLIAEKTVLRIRTLLITVIAWVFISYVQQHEWLDVIHTTLWFALIALLELEVRWPDIVLKYYRHYWLATVIVFAGLIAIVVTFTWQTAWLEVYDAILWIIAFSSLEKDIFQLLQLKRA